MMSNESPHRNPALPARVPLVPNAVLGVLIFMLTEAMFFAGMISAHTIAQAGTPSGLWPPPDQPRLPVEATLINTVALLVSGVLIFIAHRQFKRQELPIKTMLAGLSLGAFFLVFQGMEWIALIGEGLTMHSSNHGAFFYMIVGTHGLHVLGGLSALGGLFFQMRARTLTEPALAAGALFWYFVVGLWPILYWQVYL